MAFGLPCIAFDSAQGASEIIKDGYNGYLVPAKEAAPLAAAIEKLVNDASLRKTMGEHSRIIAEKDFSIENVVQKHFEIYQKLA